MYEQSPSVSYQNILQQVKKIIKTRKNKNTSENLQKLELTEDTGHPEHLKMCITHLIYVTILECLEIFIDIEH